MYSETEMKSITNTQPRFASARVIQVIKYSKSPDIVRMRIGGSLLLELITPIIRALHHLGDQIGCGIKSI